MEIQYEIHYKKNAKRIIIRSNHRGGLKVTAPYGISREKIDKIIKINEKRISVYFTKKEKLYYLGKEYKVIDNVWDLESNKVIKEENYIVVFRLAENKVLDVLNIWLKKEAFRIIKDRVEYYSNLMNVKAKDIKIKEVSTIWGSCNSQGELSFNYLLVKAPLKEIDYVVVHELAHIKYLDHSKNFWNLVKKVLPDYKNREVWLKENFLSLI